MDESDRIAMDAAADEAKQDLERIVSQMTPEQKIAFERVSTWMKVHYMKAGYKRLSKVLIAQRG